MALVLVLFATIAVLFAILQWRALQRNIAAAKSSGFMVVVSPVHFMSIPWLISQELLLPLLHKLPSSWTESWLPLAIFSGTWRAGYEPFERNKEDSFIVASPGGNTLWTCNPEIIIQATEHREDIQKASAILRLLNNYGPSLTASEGRLAHTFRKITAPAFDERNNDYVWKESLFQTGLMLDKWKGEGHIINHLGRDSSSMALHVLSKRFFDKDLRWTQSEEEIPEGHTLSFKGAIRAAFKHNIMIFVTPWIILNYSPLAIHREAREAYREWRTYMEEMRDEAVDELRSDSAKCKTLIHHIVRAGTPDLQDPEMSISPEAVLGNIFLFVLAGHESSAVTLWNAVTILACKPAVQRAVQSDIDAVLGGRVVDQLAYPRDYNRLMAGCVGALMKETLRQYPISTFLPKINPEGPIFVTSKGKRYLLPQDTLIMLDTCAAHRHPKYWPPTPEEKNHAAVDSRPYPVSTFALERWLARRNTRDPMTAEKEPAESDQKVQSTTVASPASPSTPPALSSPQPSTPTRGAYIPFAEGHRACLGKQFAQVEFCAAIARILSQFHVKLANAPDGGPSFADAERALSDGIGFEMGIKMKDPVRLRIEPR